MIGSTRNVPAAGEVIPARSGCRRPKIAWLKKEAPSSAVMTLVAKPYMRLAQVLVYIAITRGNPGGAPACVQPNISKVTSLDS